VFFSAFVFVFSFAALLLAAALLSWFSLVVVPQTAYILSPLEALLLGQMAL